MTPKKAQTEFRWMLATARMSERNLASDHKLLGDACRELRLAHGLTTSDVCAGANHPGLNLDILSYEKGGCCVNEARLYRAGVAAALKQRAAMKRARRAHDKTQAAINRGKP